MTPRRHVDEFRDPDAARALLRTIATRAERLDDPLAVMEVCGGHTHTIYRYGLEHLLPDRIELLHGPGCPVCVIPRGRLDDALWLADQPGVTLATFGDLMRVPGSGRHSLLDARAQGADVRFVYSPLDALELARTHPDREVVFVAIGFETTAPATAVTVERARALGVRNFSVFCNHVTIEPPLRALCDGGDSRIGAFIAPGHVATVIGTRGFEFLPAEYGRPAVVTGFEPLDILQALAMLLEQIVSGAVAAGRATVGNQYGRAVRADGNPTALALLRRVFAVREAFEWRGLGVIPHSGLRLAPAFADLDAEVRFRVPGARVADPAACQCGAVLTGRLAPERCRAFGTACTPDHPIGACMVSPEGACAAAFGFGGLDRATARAVGGPEA
nr:hydrogenase formation protein HypD [Propionibacterium sp.]